MKGTEESAAPGGAPAGCKPEELPALIETRGPPRGLVQRTVLLVGAGVCFVLGVIGWLVPVVTGVPFYLAAAVLLGLASPAAARWVNARERSLPYRWRLLLRRGRRPEDPGAA